MNPVFNIFSTVSKLYTSATTDVIRFGYGAVVFQDWNDAEINPYLFMTKVTSYLFKKTCTVANNKNFSCVIDNNRMFNIFF